LSSFLFAESDDAEDEADHKEDEIEDVSDTRKLGAWNNLARKIPDRAPLPLEVVTEFSQVDRQLEDEQPVDETASSPADTGKQDAAVITPATGNSTESIYQEYLQTAAEVSGIHARALVPMMILCFLLLAFTIALVLDRLADQDIRMALWAFGLGLGVTLVLAVFYISSTNRQVKDEIEQIILSKPGFDHFYEFYRPHWQRRVWPKGMATREDYDLFLFLIGRK
jgi:hypothetical protein